MKEICRELYTRLKSAMKSQCGAGMIEYALIIALLSFGTTAGMAKTAKGVTKAFTKITTNLKTEIPKKAK